MGIRDFYLPEFMRCPICGTALACEGGSLFCSGERRHTYDIAKEGYVNLLPPGRAKNARTGDGADMVKARLDFLGSGGYDRYSREAMMIASGFLGGEGDLVLIDSGCGEGRHTANMARTLSEVCSRDVVAVGFDASKHGVRTAAKRYSLRDSARTSYFAANIFSMPVADCCADVFTSLFAPLPDDEVKRVLRPGGLLVICAAGGEHLCEMREILYENPVPSGGGALVPDGFEVLLEEMIEYRLDLPTNDDVMALFTMTPFYHNAPPEGRAKLESKDQLTVTVQVKCTVAGREAPTGR